MSQNDEGVPPGRRRHAGRKNQADEGVSPGMGMGAAIAIGVGVGIAMGVALDSIAIGLAIGMGIAIAFGASSIAATGANKPDEAARRTRRRTDDPEGDI